MRHTHTQNTEKSILVKARHGFKKDLEELFESCVILFGIQFQDTRKKTKCSQCNHSNARITYSMYGTMKRKGALLLPTSYQLES